MNDELYISLVGEAFDGYTEAQIEGKEAYFKHISLKDQRYLHKYYEKYKNLALSRGLESEKDRLKYVIEEEIWSHEEDSEIASKEFEIKNLKNTQNLLPLPSQREEMHNTIKEKQKELAELLTKRQEVIGKTAEEYATTRSSDEILRFLLFKDPDLTEHLYTEEEFGRLESWEVIKINMAQADIGERFTDLKIQEAVLRPFFSMYLSLCEDVYGFYRKPVTALSVYQLRVALYGRMFFNIFQNTDDIPDDIKQDPEKLLAFSDAQRNKDKRKTGIKDDADSSFVFGATKSDMKTFDAAQGNKALSEEAEKHGGQLNMEQMMRLAGHDV